MWIGRALLRLTANRVPPGRLRRSALAAAQVALSTATPGLIAVLIHVGLDWNSQLSDSTSNLLAAMVITVFSAATLGAGQRPAVGPPSVLAPAAHQRCRGAEAELGTCNDGRADRADLAGRTPDGAAEHQPDHHHHTDRDRVHPDHGHHGDRARHRPRCAARPETGRRHHSGLGAGADRHRLGRADREPGQPARGLRRNRQLPGQAGPVGADRAGLGLSGVHADRRRLQFAAKLAPTRDRRKVPAHPARPGGRAAVRRRPGSSGTADHHAAAGAIRRRPHRPAAALRPAAQGTGHRRGADSSGRRAAGAHRAGAGPAGREDAQRWLSNRYLPTTELDPGMQLSAVTLFGYAGFVVAVALACRRPASDWNGWPGSPAPCPWVSVSACRPLCRTSCRA